MAHSENPFHRAFWLGETDPRPLALFRIALGLVVLHDLANYAVDLRAFLTDDGMLPRGVQVEPRAISLFDTVGSTGAVAVIFAAGVCAVVAFAVGYRTRIATALSWLFLTSLHTRNLYVTDGGDDLVRNLMFLSMFADLGARFSFDERRRGAAPSAVPAIGLRFLQLHIALLYFCAGRLKFRAGWMTHNVLYQCLQLTGFVRPPGHWLLAVPSLCLAIGAATVVLELCFALLAFSPWQVLRTRALAIASGLAVQMGILLTMRVGVFTETMIVAMLLFMQPEWLDRLAVRLAWVGSASGHAATFTTSPRLRGILLFVLSFHFLALAWGPFIGRRFPAPAVLTAERRWLWLEQPFGLFDVVYDIPRWEVRGTLADGTDVDLLETAVPALVPEIAWSFSRWYKFTFKERERPYPFVAIGNYFCTEYARKSGSSLASLAIFENLTPPIVPNQPVDPAVRRERHQATCPR
jgi:hypothetical protein